MEESKLKFKKKRYKSALNELHVDVLYESLTALEAEVFRFVVMHYK